LLADAPPGEARPLDPAVAASLQQMMGLVVAEGTGTAAALPGAPVHGKTGTAEFGTATPPQTHAWFIGFRDNLAFAVLVEDGGFGGEVAAPIAARFLTLVGGA
ncbi:MAG: penicillin-binding transpeptidase domain-containing protein, partial [Acidimicrobiia bacterium]